MHFIDEKVATLCGRLKELADRKVCELDGFEYQACGYKTDNEIPKEGWRAFPKDGRVGGVDAHYWFRGKVKTPAAEEGEQLYFKLLTGREGGWDARNPQCLLYLNGVMVQGLDVNHTDFPLDPDREYDFALYFYVGMEEGLVEFLPTLHRLDLATEKLYYDLKVPLDACGCLEKGSEQYVRILRELEVACQPIDLRDPYSEGYYEGIRSATEYLERNFYGALCGNSTAIVDCVGHTHIDVAWLWTLAQTAEKSQRTFSTMIMLLKRYPEFIFMSSQPQLYKYVKQHAPELYEEIKEMVRQGRWEVEGAMWVEADCNLISGESMVRQILFGKRFMMEEFGVDSKILWLPDVFGYSAAMPQVLRKSGVDYFVTSKISWNELNKMPYDTFYWRGIDGTEVFTNFLTAQELKKPGENDNFTTYNAHVNPSFVAGTWRRYQQKEYNNETVITFGYGDGGGGPTKDMLEQQRRMSYGLPGFPRTRMTTTREWLENTEKNFRANAEKLRRRPTWSGELYLELHRGTYTSIAKNKRNNRKGEFMYQTAETLSVLDLLLLDGIYPQQAINEGWEILLLNQFHDIIPGSSIFEVYEDCDMHYAKLFAQGGLMVGGKLDNLARQIGGEHGVLVYNPNSFTSTDIIRHHGKAALAEEIPPLGWKIVEPKTGNGGVRVEKNSIENRFFQVEFDTNGNIVSIYDKECNREVVAPGGKANELQAFEDYPKAHDAWEISLYYKEKMWSVDGVVGTETVDDGVRSGIRFTRRFSLSEIIQTVYLYEDIKKIDFVTEVDWHEDHVMLKAAFPLDLNTDKATYEIQFGNLERPTHGNTTWDLGRFEVCAHKWADMSEDGYGVSLLNDSKYGYSAEGNTLKLTLLKSATHPNPQADRGKHYFVYSLAPHAGDYRSAGIVQMAYALNRPMLARDLTVDENAPAVPEPTGEKLPAEFSLIRCDCENVVIETVKKAEDSDAVIVRMYEAYNRRTDATLTFGTKFSGAVLCDLLENEIRPLELTGNAVTIPIKGFEIVTLKLTR